MSIESVKPERSKLRPLLWSVSVASLAVTGFLGYKKHYYDVSTIHSKDGKFSGIDINGPYVPLPSTTIDLTDTGLLVRKIRESVKTDWCSEVKITDQATSEQGAVCADAQSLRIGTNGRAEVTMAVAPKQLNGDGPNLYLTFAKNPATCKTATEEITSGFNATVTKAFGETVAHELNLKVIVDARKPADACENICTADIAEANNCPSPITDIITETTNG